MASNGILQRLVPRRPLGRSEQGPREDPWRALEHEVREGFAELSLFQPSWVSSERLWRPMDHEIPN